MNFEQLNISFEAKAYQQTLPLSPRSDDRIIKAIFVDSDIQAFEACGSEKSFLNGQYHRPD